MTDPMFIKLSQTILSYTVPCYTKPTEPHSSVGSVADPRLGQYSFRGLIIVIATGFIPLTAVPTMVMWQSSQWLKEYCAEY